MPFSQADLDALDRAMVALTSGTQVQEVRFSDGRSVKYTPATLADLVRARSTMQAEVAATGAVTPDRPGGVTYAEWGGF